jgi:dihydrofolate reductase
MGKVIWHVTMSLDGYIAGPDDAMEWVFEYPGPTRLANEVIQTTGAVLAGRRSYEVGRRDAGKESGEVYGGAWTGPQFVLTHSAPKGEEDSSVTFLSGDIEVAVARVLASAGGKNVVVIGADVARQCIDRGLIDEIVVHLAPVLLGGGVRLFEGPGTRPINLERIRAGTSGQLTDLRFAVANRGG